MQVGGGWKNAEEHVKKKKKTLDCLEQTVNRYLDFKDTPGE